MGRSIPAFLGYTAPMLLTGHRDGFGPGFTAVTTLDDESGIALGVLKLMPGESVREKTENETAWLLISGELEHGSEKLSRGDPFDDGPAAVHVSAGTQMALTAIGPSEVLVMRVANKTPFAQRTYTSVKDEHRGKGLVHDASYRFVRTVFDGNNAPPESQLVLGEVVNMPGRWSSYPPHHHPQPELYHYRFDKPDGYGHAELGEQVFKVKGFDTLRILSGADHPQCAAPGYAMWYAWVIRHLPGARYDRPEFDAKHRWVLAEGAKDWWPRGVNEP
ncbi:MAG: 5-deoxy-glucuronate isomerase [Myxococcaceae bacterium]|nr:5-deoxy-glucuronate isomerase [Myxococcaceae bacterium]